MKRTLILLSMLHVLATAGKIPFGADKEIMPTPAPSIGERAKIGIRFIFWRNEYTLPIKSGGLCIR